jgi:hypothetical protein
MGLDDLQWNEVHTKLRENRLIVLEVEMGRYNRHTQLVDLMPLLSFLQKQK